ncbi:phosphate acyltransferase PlsX [Mycoplasma zalophidermidis]|uniref:Phosphate acyltransferase n=1 Tax=Mycoplasma zalophidermidis TaxID=398174 RepID=A0ABS6DRY8_9MOLU|nr:phosphate acyltransferase PlsX [Mycoplasma zalophidermidis]MBU4689927.1 phosphate acyltransferase PlsX [Mycoplasma zalophidermidis]MBU4693782.1 phosphate acyltransferase PlsX [Mycoplasma zalophidermidis]MCR8966788.1 phosphate acyltransferase PlsX [Mycoplasma zalophidermidis]
MADKTKKYTIAFDINGNDNGIKAGVVASYQFALQNPNFEIILVGPKNEIRNIDVPGIKEKPQNISIIDNDKIALNPENIRASLHEETSMNIAIELVKDNKADAVLSSGNSGLYLALNTFKLKRLENVSRAAFMPIMPTITGRKFLMLDVGANIDTKPEYLVEWANIANVFAKIMLQIKTPRVSLINIGTEDNKGLEIIRQAHLMLNESKTINYIGFREPREILNAVCDVAVIDGYGGNLVLKSLEGAILSFKSLLKSKILASPIRKLGYMLAKNAFNDVAETLDYRNVGAAWVVGVNGVAIKSHGSSDDKAYTGALNQIKIALENDVLTKVKESVKDLNE